MDLAGSCHPIDDGKATSNQLGHQGTPTAKGPLWLASSAEVHMGGGIVFPDPEAPGDDAQTSAVQSVRCSDCGATGTTRPGKAHPGCGGTFYPDKRGREPDDHGSA